MKILFILPPSKFAIKDTVGVPGMPLGLAYLASSLGEKGHRVKIIDAPTLNYDWENLREEMRGFKPDIVGITSTTSTIYDAYKVAELVKECNSRIKVVGGGPHVSFTPEETLKECSSVDIVVRGEGEETMKEIADSFEMRLPLEEIRGITFRDNGEIVETENRPFIENLDELPFPAHSLLPMDKYRAGKKQFANVITSRGCPFSCIFCSSSQLCGKRWRARSPESVIKELEILKDEYNIHEVEVLDDTFTLNNKRAEKICDLIIKKGLHISWSASSRVNTITQELAYKMRSAGCHILYFGIESGSQKILNIIQKGITLSQSEKAVQIAKRANINAFGTFIIGIPGETKETIKKTIKFAKKLNPGLAQFTICTPYPGTKLFKIAKEKHLLLTKDWSKYTILHPVMKIPGIVSKKLRRWLIRIYLSFYLRPRFIMGQIKKRNLFIVKKAFKAALNYLNS